MGLAFACEIPMTCVKNSADCTPGKLRSSMWPIKIVVEIVEFCSGLSCYLLDTLFHYQNCAYLTNYLWKSPFSMITKTACAASTALLYWRGMKSKCSLIARAVSGNWRSGWPTSMHWYWSANAPSFRDSYCASCPSLSWFHRPARSAGISMLLPPLNAASGLSKASATRPHRQNWLGH